MKNTILAILGVVGSSIANLLGGFDMALQILLIFMVADFFSGYIVGAMGKSKKTDTGTLSSYVGWKGLCKKGMALLVVLVGSQLDRLSGTEFIRDAVIIGYIANEALSIIENAGLMGVPAAKALTKFIDVLIKRSEGGEDENQ